MCINRTLTKGRLHGWITGFGAASADACYAAIAGFGLSALAAMLIDQLLWIRLAGGLFLLYLGVKIFFRRSVSIRAQSTGSGMAGDYASAFVLTLTNPMTVIAFAAIFTGFGLELQGADTRYSVMLVCGIFTGSATWSIFLCTIVSLFRQKITERFMFIVNRIAGIVIFGFGVFILLDTLFFSA